MNDTSLEMLSIKGLDQCHSLEYLNLALNSISCRGIDVMSSYFNSSNAMSLKTLLLHWNRIRGRGAVRLFKLLARGAKNLKELDLSFNSIGQFQALGQPKEANTQNEDDLQLKQELNKFREKIPLSVYKLGRFIAKND
jgi:Ran GTPase-activating protein (RanGAP) involved in mRNA processing and transport